MTIEHKDVVPADRRAFLKTMGAAALAMGARLPAFGAAATNVRLGVDMFSVGAQNWTPFEMLDWAAKMKLNVVHFSEIRFLGSPDWQVALAPDNLRQIRARADELHIDIEIGMRSICPTSVDFNKTLGTADEQIGRMLAAAKIVRSPIVRCVLGVQADRRTGIETHIDQTVKVLKANRSKIVDAGVKIAIENHAGDMQARELKGLVERASPDYVGVCLDSGNPVWVLEDPHLTLETLAPYVQTSHVRDSYIFNSPQGTAVRWTRMGEGNIGIEDYIRTYVQKCPGKPMSLEVIVQPRYRIFNYRDPAAWEIFKTMPAWEFARFLTLAERGVPQDLPPAGQSTGTPPGRTGAAAAARAGGGTRGAQGGAGQRVNPEAQKRNLEDVEASVRWTRQLLATL